MGFRFGELELDTDHYELRKAGEKVPVQPKVFDVLRYLIEHRDRVVTKQELLTELWPGEHVNETAVSWSISHVRRAVGQEGRASGPIQTVHGRGYRFTASVEPEPEAEAPSVPERFSPSLPPPAPPAPARMFVGRDATMQRLADRLEAATVGQGGLCLLVGEAGIGKTRCATELSEGARARGLLAYTGRCVEGHGAPAFWSWIQIGRAIARDHEPLREQAESLIARMSGEPTADPEDRGDAVSRRFWLLEEVSRLLFELAAQVPILIVLDDLHWADSGTLALLALVAPELAQRSILIVVTMRDDSTSTDTERAVGRLARHAERITLDRLDVADVARLLEEATGAEGAQRLAEAVHRASAGNPLFVKETIRALLATYPTAALARLEPEDVRLPDLARDLLRERIQSLSADVRAVLDQAAVLGMGFELPTLTRVVGIDEATAITHLDTCVRAGLVVREGPSAYRFGHEIVRDIAYGEIKTADQVKLHRRAAEALSPLVDAGARIGEVARHYYLSLPAGDYGKVSEHAQRAADAATRVFAYEDAVTFLDWALEAQAFDTSVTAEDRARLLLANGQAQRSAGRTNESRNVLERAIEIGRQHGLPDVLVRAAQTLRPTVGVASVPDRLCKDALEQVLRLVPDEPNPLRVRALSQLAWLPPHSLDMRRSKELSGRAVELARQTEGRTALSEALRSRLYSLSGPDDIDACIALTDEIVAFEENALTWLSGDAWVARYAVHLMQCDMAKANWALDRMGAVARELRFPEALLFHERLCAQREFALGRVDEAETRYRQMRKQGRRLGLGYWPMFYSVQMFQLRVERDGLRVAAGSWDPRQTDPDRLDLVPSFRANLARNAAALGIRDFAQRVLDSFASRNFEDVPRDLGYLHALCQLALATVHLADRARAEQLYGLLSPYADFNTPDEMSFFAGSVSHFLGLLAASLGRDEKAVEHLEHALAVHERMGTLLVATRTRIELARVLAARKVAASTRRARELAGEAQEAARELKLPAREREAAEILAALG